MIMRRPAEFLENATDYMPTDRRVLFGHHFAAIAGAGPLVGPVLACSRLSAGTIWIFIGAVLAGYVQDYLVLSISVPSRSLARADGARRTRRRRRLAAIGLCSYHVILLAVLGLVVVDALAESPGACSPSR